MGFGQLYPKSNWMKKENVGNEGTTVTVMQGTDESSFEDKETMQTNKYVVINVQHNEEEFQLRLNRTSYENIVARLRKEKEDWKFDLDDKNFDENMVGRKLDLIVVNGTPSYILVQKMHPRE